MPKPKSKPRADVLIAELSALYDELVDIVGEAAAAAMLDRIMATVEAEVRNAQT